MKTFKLFLVIFSCVVLRTEAYLPPLFITPLIEAGDPMKAKNLSIVDPTLFLNVSSYSGYITIDKKYDSNMFFWYFPVQNKPYKAVENTPWIIWLQGGPGSSSLVGLFDEMGPFHYEKGELKLRESAWTTKYSMLFIDNPIGAGFSYTKNDKGYALNMDMIAENLYNMIQQFLTVFPELLKADLYIAGESYAGRYVPAIGMKILEENAKPSRPKYKNINLKGLILGNPVIDREDIMDYTSVFEQWGILDTQGVLTLKPLQDAYIKAIRKDRTKKALDLRGKLLDQIADLSSTSQNYNVLKDDISFQGFSEFLNNNSIKDAIHVGSSEFKFSDQKAGDMLNGDYLGKTRHKVVKLLENYRMLIYCGQLDAVSSCVLNSRARREKWFWNRRDEFLNASRVPWWYNESIAGYVKSGGGFTEVLVRGAGHLVPMDKPAEALNLIDYFIRGLDLVMPPNYNPVPPGLDVQEKSENSDSKTVDTGLIVSVVFNIILLLILAALLLLYLRWRRNRVDYVYQTDDTISDGILSMS